MSSEAPHHLDVAIGRRIRDRRRAAGISQGHLARAIGVTFQQVQKYERGANRVSFSRLMDIVAALGCQLSDLAEGLGSEQSAGEVEQARRLIAEAGATELLQAYAQLSSPSLRQALIQHARALAGAAKAEAEA
ncbi:MAG TPA: helix-turn-helix transcriptional regulator [Caulobacteraceae bacterium]|jgi:transcriptional regulator with XRE-family HTH domain